MVNVEDSAGTIIELRILHSVYDWLTLCSVREYLTLVRMSPSSSGWKLQNWDRERRFNFVPCAASSSGLIHLLYIRFEEMDFTALALSVVRPSVRNQDFLIFFSGITAWRQPLEFWCAASAKLPTSHLYNTFCLFTEFIFQH